MEEHDDEFKKSVIALTLALSCLAVGVPSGSPPAVAAPAAPAQIDIYDGIWFIFIARCLGYCGPVGSPWCPCTIIEF